jgi:hypothetical protein
MIYLPLSSCWLCPGLDESSGPHITDNPNRCACGCSNLVSLARVLGAGRDSSLTEKRLMTKIESGYVELVSGAGLGLVPSAHRAEQCG